MTSNSFFLSRAVARDADWQVNYPALTMASAIDAVDERRKQIVVAAADETSLRAVFFSSLGAILDIHATWDELDQSAKGWLSFTIRWNRWWLPNADHVELLKQHAFVPTDLRFANREVAAAPGDTAAFREYLDVVELHYRRDAAISSVLFPPNAVAAVGTSRSDAAGRYLQKRRCARSFPSQGEPSLLNRSATIRPGVHTGTYGSSKMALPSRASNVTSRSAHCGPSQCCLNSTR